MAAIMKIFLWIGFLCALTYGEDSIWTEFIKDTHDDPEHRDGIISTPTEFASLRKFFLKEDIDLGIINAAILNDDDDGDGQINGEEYAELRMQLLPIAHIV